MHEKVGYLKARLIFFFSEILAGLLAPYELLQTGSQNSYSGFNNSGENFIYRNFKKKKSYCKSSYGNTQQKALERDQDGVGSLAS